MCTVSGYSAAMPRLRKKSGLMQSLMLAMVLFAAQALASAHGLEHDDPGKSQSPVCAACVAASQLGAACIDSGIGTTAVHYAYLACFSPACPFVSAYPLPVRQRGPPLSLT